MSSQPEAPDSAVETPAPHKAEVPQGEVLPEPAEPPSEWQIDDGTRSVLPAFGTVTDVSHRLQ